MSQAIAGGEQIPLIHSMAMDESPRGPGGRGGFWLLCQFRLLRERGCRLTMIEKLGIPTVFCCGY
jgi:hypothetical protein